MTKSSEGTTVNISIVKSLAVRSGYVDWGNVRTQIESALGPIFTSNTISQQMSCHEAGAAADYFTHDQVFNLEDWRSSNPGWGTPGQAIYTATPGGTFNPSGVCNW